MAFKIPKQFEKKTYPCQHCRGYVSMGNRYHDDQDEPELIWVCPNCDCIWSVDGELTDQGHLCDPEHPELFEELKRAYLQAQINLDTDEV